MKFQRSKAENQAILCLGCEREDVMLCQSNTVRVWWWCIVDLHWWCCSQPIHRQLPDQVDGRECTFEASADPCSLDPYSNQSLHFVLDVPCVWNVRYKSLLITMAEFFFSFYNGYSPSMLFTPSFHFMYETLFTSLFSFALFTFYSDVNHYDIRRNAFAFAKCQKDFFFNRSKLLLILIDTIYQGFIIFYVPASVLIDSEIDPPIR